jgi:hypothetical protein
MLGGARSASSIPAVSVGMSANRSNDVANRLKVGAERPDGEGTRPNFAPCRASTLTSPVRARGLVLGPLDARQDQMARRTRQRTSPGDGRRWTRASRIGRVMRLISLWQGSEQGLPSPGARRDAPPRSCTSSRFSARPRRRGTLTRNGRSSTTRAKAVESDTR